MEEKDERIKGHCPSCSGDRFADPVASFNDGWSDDAHGMWGRTSYNILRCRGCETVYFRKAEVFSEEMDRRQDPHTGEWEAYLPETVTYWPAPTERQQPAWTRQLPLVDHDLHRLLQEGYKAYDNDLGVLAAIGIRTVFDRSSELLDIDPALSFAEKLNALLANGKIGVAERETLDTLTDAGGAAAHRGWRPSPEQLDTMMSVVEAFIYRNFVLDEAVKRLKATVPPKPKRGKNGGKAAP
jgi:hypothetical protein